MKRPNIASRAAATTVVGKGSGFVQSSSASPPDTLKPEVTLRRGDAATASESPLEELENEVASLRKIIAEEQAEIISMQASLQELFMRNACEEYLHKLEKRLQIIENREVESVLWRIENAEQMRGKYIKGQYISSPQFAACGLDGFSFHFYPRGDDFSEEGYCSLFFHIPTNARIKRTLFMGRSRHGPEEAEGLKNAGVSEMGVLSNEIDRATGSLVLGVDGLQVLSAPSAVETRTKIQLVTS